MSSSWRFCRPLVAVWLMAVGCTRPVDTRRALEPPRALRLGGVMSIAPDTSFPALGGLRFGGVSGIAFDKARGELLGICDDSHDVRVFRMRIREDPLDVDPIGVIRLEPSPDAPPKLDSEGLAILPDGHLLIATEGSGSANPRVPPALLEYTGEGGFVRQLPVPPKFVPTPRGPQVSGVRNNEAFEGLTLTPDAHFLFTGTESALVQDGDAASFERGAPSRLIQYERGHDGRYAPIHEFVYDVDSIDRPAFAPGTAINGLVELLALDARVLLALERSYVDDPSRPGYGVNRIRLYRVSIDGATDVSDVASLKGARVRAVSKTLVLDLDKVPNLPADLHGLDNFEGLALLPARNGARTLLMVSDDNFSAAERTWFLRIEF